MDKDCCRYYRRVNQDCGGRGANLGCCRAGRRRVNEGRCRGYRRVNLNGCGIDKGRCRVDEDRCWMDEDRCCGIAGFGGMGVFGRGSCRIYGRIFMLKRDNSYVDNLALVQFLPFLVIRAFRHIKSVLMRKTIVINTLLILGYYLVLQLLIWISMVLR
jgi:hypothetical protein